MVGSDRDSSSALDVGTKLSVAASMVSALHQFRTSCYAHTDSALQILNTPEQLGVEQFHHLVATARNIAVARPGNLVRFAEQTVLQVPQLGKSEVQ